MTASAGTYALLTDGAAVAIRPAAAGDADAVREMHAGLSQENLYLRFFTVSPISAEREAGRICRPPDRMAFTFTRAFRSYRFEFTSKLIGDASGRVIPLRGSGVLRMVFTLAQAHTGDGSRSTIVSQPARDLGLPRMTSYAQAGEAGTVSSGSGSGSGSGPGHGTAADWESE